MKYPATFPCGRVTDAAGKLSKPCKDAAPTFEAAAAAVRRGWALTPAERDQRLADEAWLRTHVRQGRGQMAAIERAERKAAARQAARR